MKLYVRYGEDRCKDVLLLEKDLCTWVDALAVDISIVTDLSKNKHTIR